MLFKFVVVMLFIMNEEGRKVVAFFSQNFVFHSYSSLLSFLVMFFYGTSSPHIMKLCSVLVFLYWEFILKYVMYVNASE